MFFINCGYDVNLGVETCIFNYDSTICPKWSNYNNRIYFIIPSYKGSASVICSIDENDSDFNVIDFKDQFYGAIESFSISPDGKFIVFAGVVLTDSNNIGNTYNIMFIYKYSFETGTIENLFDNNNFIHNGSPTWNIDNWIYFIRDNGDLFGSSEIWRMRPDGSELNKVQVDIKRYIYNINNSKDGKYLVIGAYGGYRNDDIYLLNLESLNISKIDNDEYFSDPCLSPDSKWICISHYEDKPELYVTPSFRDFDPVKITKKEDNPGSGDSQPDWSPNGEFIVFERDYGWIYKVKVPDEFLPK